MLARESTLREPQLDHQLTDLRARVASIGGTVDQEIPENAVSAFKRKRVQLPDGTFGFRAPPQVGQFRLGDVDQERDYLLVHVTTLWPSSIRG